MTMRTMRRTRPIAALLVAGGLALGLVACGDDTSDDDADVTLPDVSGTTAPPAGDGTSGSYEYPTGADEVVFEETEVGGFTTRAFAFQRTPNLLVSGAGQAFSPGPQIEIYPGPLLPAVQVQSITDEGIEALLGAADDAGLFADVDYDAPTNIADAGTTVVTIDVDGEIWVHEAYALGLSGPGGGGDESTPERQALADFVAQLRDLPGLVGADNLGETEVFEPDAFAIEAIALDDLSAFGSDGIEPTVVPWPDDAGVALADAATCTEISSAGVIEAFTAANQLTFFDDDGVVYQVLVRPVLPGNGCA